MLSIARWKFEYFDFPQFDAMFDIYISHLPLFLQDMRHKRFKIGHGGTILTFRHETESVII